MKNLLLTLFIITGFAACKSNTQSDSQKRDIQLLSDSSAFTNNNIYTDTVVSAKSEVVPTKISNAPERMVKVKRQVSLPEKNIKSATVKTSTSNKTPEVIPPVVTPPVVTGNSGTATNTGAANEGTAGSGNGTSSGTPTTIPQPEKKKGWNKAAQGAVIGGVTGAVGGAILSKKKGLGAVIGGVVGAAGGYIIGNGMDKKDNKYYIQ
jgi:hypothetical protein